MDQIYEYILAIAEEVLRMPLRNYMLHSLH